MYKRCPDLCRIIKNPNNSLVIRRYNREIIRNNADDLFDLIEQEIETRLMEQFDEEFKSTLKEQFNEFNVKYDRTARIGDKYGHLEIKKISLQTRDIEPNS